MRWVYLVLVAIVRIGGLPLLLLLAALSGASAQQVPAPEWLTEAERYQDTLDEDLEGMDGLSDNQPSAADPPAGREPEPTVDLLAQPPHSFERYGYESRLQRDHRIIRGLGADDRSRRDWRTRDNDAFAATGMRRGGLVFYPEIYGGLITSNNLFAARSGETSAFGQELRPGLQVASNWNNHALELFAQARARRWQKFSSENTLEFETRLRGRIDITRRSEFENGIRFERKMEGRGSADLADGAAKPGVLYEQEFYSQFTHRFNRFGFRLRGRLTRTRHEDVKLNNGSIEDNGFRHLDARHLALRTHYEFAPGFGLFADTELTDRVYQQKRDPDGHLQNSAGWTAALGTALEFGPQFSFLGRIGYGRLSPDERTFNALEGIVYDARLIWRPTRLITATLEGRGELEATDQSGSPGAYAQVYAAELVNSWSHRFTSTLKADYQIKDYEGIADVYRELKLDMGLEYLFHRSLALEADLEHTTVPGAYKENQLRLGLRWRR